jgi:hypothetical protein
MRERQHLEELSGAVSLGLLAEDMVIVIGRVMRGETLNAKDRRVLEMARALFATLGCADVILPAAGRDQMLSDDAYFDALRAVETQVPGQEAQAAAARLVELLDTVLTGDVDQVAAHELHALRAVFIDVGKATLMRANDLSRSRQEPYPWRPMRVISPS